MSRATTAPSCTSNSACPGGAGTVRTAGHPVPVGHAFERGDDALDLGGVHVEAPGDDHVLLAVDDVQESVLDVPDVPGGRPAVVEEDRGGLGRLPPVPSHRRVAARLDLALAAVRHRRSAVPDQSYLD